MINSALAEGRIPVDVPHEGLLDGRIGDAGIPQRPLDGRVGYIRVIGVGRGRFGEGGHSHADHIDFHLKIYYWWKL